MSLLRYCSRLFLCVSGIVLQYAALDAAFMGQAYADDAESKFYTVIDSDGHMRTIQRDTDQAPISATPAPSKAVTPESPTLTLNGEKYVDSDYLEKREFNLEGKSRFYPIPDGQGGTEVIERVPGAIQKPQPQPKIQANKPPVLVTLSSKYQRVPASEITPLINKTCLPISELQQSKLLRDQLLILWPRSDKPAVNHKASLNYELVEFRSAIKDISLQSFAPLSQQSAYYWPLPIFLDERGCVLEGVNGFYQKKLPATLLQPSILIGTLHVPDHTRYLMLTPLVEAIDLPGTTLSPVGQVRLLPLR
ncbi:putative pilus assembly protein FilE [Aquirhabdus sp.]|uniref:putative pilus assembly protein FilE n=1 Tax=Aquirhabdus sp. TaxID=2824160 RepID=UPI00396D0268